MPRRTTVWSSASRMRIFSGCVRHFTGSRSCTSVPCGATWTTLQVGADEQRALAHPADAVAGAQPGRVDALAVVAHAQHDLAVLGLEAELGAGGARVADDVDEALLGDAVDHELVLAAERRELAVEVRRDAQAAVLGELGAERDERRAQPEVVERLRPQPAHEVAHLLDAGARGRLERAQLGLQLLGRAALERLELQHDAGQRLPDLVVQLARHPPPLLLLRVERAAGAVAALALEPVEHVVERVAELGDLGRLALDLDPLPGGERVDAAHQRGQALERAEHAPQREQVDGQHRRDAEPEHRDLAAR